MLPSIHPRTKKKNRTGREHFNFSPFNVPSPSFVHFSREETGVVWWYETRLPGLVSYVRINYILFGILFCLWRWGLGGYSFLRFSPLVSLTTRGDAHLADQIAERRTSETNAGTAKEGRCVVFHRGQCATYIVLGAHARRQGRQSEPAAIGDPLFLRLMNRDRNRCYGPKDAGPVYAEGT